MKKLFFFTLSLLFFQLSVVVIQAAPPTLSVDCSTACVKSGTDPLFSKNTDGYWYPGLTRTKIVRLTNSAGENKEMAMKASRTSQSSLLENVISVQISHVVTSEVIWSGSLADFYQQSKITFGIFSPQQSKEFSVRVMMDSNADNHYQKLESVFNLQLGFWLEEGTNQQSGSDTGSSGGGTSGGGNTVAVTAPDGVLGAADKSIESEILGASDKKNESIKKVKEKPSQSPRDSIGFSCERSIWLLLLMQLPLVFLAIREVGRVSKKKKNLVIKGVAAVSIIILWFMICFVSLFILMSFLVYLCLFLFQSRYVKDKGL